VHAWFLCGPQALVESTRVELDTAGVEGRVLTELFHVGPVSTEAPADPTQAEPPGIDAEVALVLDGAERSISVPTGQTVLDAALQARVDVPYSCAGGACGTCRALVREGEVEMEQNHALDDDEVAEGYVLTCQSHPRTPQVRLDYDV
jgi:2Fe-2S type ferredoxin